MLNRLIDWSVANRLLVVLALLGVLGAAAALIPKLNLDAFPDVTNIQVQINTEAQGLAAEEVEQLITYPIEAVMIGPARRGGGALHLEDGPVGDHCRIQGRHRHLFRSPTGVRTPAGCA